MKLLIALLKPASSLAIQKALCFLRICLGILSVGHGYPKLMGGVATWKALGAMTQYVGITCWPTLWGFLGMSAEFFGGILLILGLGVRPVALSLIIMMIVATAYHFNKGDGFQVYSFAVTLIAVFAAFFIIGGDKYSLDYRWFSK